MVFTSNPFIFIFLPLFLFFYYVASDSKRSYVIVAGSYLFYAWWRPDFLFLFVIVTYWNYFFGIKIHKLKAQNKTLAFRLLTAGVIGNVMTLGYFKYANFGAEILTGTLEALGLHIGPFEQIILPLGISFYIFQAISYLVDIYRGHATPTKRFVDFAAFISLFPQLIAGPILRYKQLAEQLHSRTHSMALFSLGVSRFQLGFIKKVIIADSIAPLNQHYLSLNNPTVVESLLGSFSSFMQLYFDFSGYSDMAIGLGLMMGFRFAENFNQPLMLMSITDYWKRWHITLSEFLRDYVLLPLVKTRMMSIDAAAFFTMVLSGVWHGASFSFVFWGIYCGVIFYIETRYNLGTDHRTPYNFPRHMFNVLLVTISMPLFCTGDLGHSLHIYAGTFGLNGFGNVDSYIYATSKMTLAFLALSVGWVIIAGYLNRQFYTSQKETYFMKEVTGWKNLLLWVGFALAISKLSATAYSPFLYFQF